MPEGTPSSRRQLVLVIDDERESRDMIALHLERDGYEAITAASGPEGLRLAAERGPEAVILDIRMPGMDGYEVCGRLRDFSDAAIVFVTVVRESEEIVRGLQLGADDYVIKPFEYSELAARLTACLRRRQRIRPFEDGTLLGGLPIDRERRTVTVAGRPVKLTPKEFEVLEFLMLTPDQVLSVDEILSSSWGPEYIGDPDLVKQFIYRLRNKLEADPSEPKYIVTVRGSGYAFEPDTRPTGGAAHASRADPRLARDVEPSGVAAALPTAFEGTADDKELSDFRSRAAERNESLRMRDPEQISQTSVDAEHRPGRASSLATRWALTGVLALSLLSAGMVAQASAGALPGDGIYPFKTALEELQLFAAAGAGRDIELHMQFSEAHVREMSELLAQDRPADLLIAVTQLESELERAGRLLDRLASDDPTEALRFIELMDGKLAFQVSELVNLRSGALGQAGVALDYAIEVSEQERSRIQGAVRSSAASNLQDRLRDASLIDAPTPGGDQMSDPPGPAAEDERPHSGDTGEDNR
jgi:DNA-binding response OmpR family regulator